MYADVNTAISHFVFKINLAIKFMKAELYETLKVCEFNLHVLLSLRSVIPLH